MKLIVSLLILLISFVVVPAWAGPVKRLCSKLQNERTYESEKKLRSYQYLVAGSDDWLFRTSSDTKEDFKIDRFGIKKMADFQAALRAHGTELVVALVPSRGLIAYPHLDRTHPWVKDYNVKLAQENYFGVLRDMNKGGIPAAGVVDFKPYLDTFFHKQDQHWTVTGARATADTVAALIKTLPVYKDLRKQVFETKAGKEIDYIGTYAERVEDMCGVHPVAEKAIQYATAPKSNLTGSSDLFGENLPPEVVLVGTSNSTPTPSYANFDGALKQALNADIYNAAVSGGGFDTALLAYLGSKEFKEHPPKILIWEFPVYYKITKSSEAGRQMNEFIAATFGSCARGGQITQSVNKLLFQETTLLSNLNAFPDSAKTSYLILNFETPVYKRFKVDIFFDNKDNRHYPFERSRTSTNADNFYLLIDPVDAPLNRIETRVHKDMIGLGLKATLCRPPITLEPFIKNLDTDGEDTNEDSEETGQDKND